MPLDQPGNLGSKTLTMKLYGNFLSPYTRRVAISLSVLEISFELETLSVFTTPDPVRPHNPLVRIPTLILDDGEPVFESGAILDAIDMMVAPANRLIPPEGKARRDVLRTCALATGVMDKAVWAFYEGRFRPAEIVHQPWIDHNEKQVLSGLEALEERVSALTDEAWLSGGESMNQADITTGVALAFANKVRPNLDILERYTSLAAYSARCEMTPAFRSAPVPE